MKRPVILAAIVAVLASTTTFLIKASAPHVPSNAWAPTGDMAHGRAGASSVLLYDGRVLVTGGKTDSGVSASAGVAPWNRYSVSRWPTGRSPASDQRTNSSAAP